jgi:hypothetical protein
MKVCKGINFRWGLMDRKDLTNDVRTQIIRVFKRSTISATNLLNSIHIFKLNKPQVWLRSMLFKFYTMYKLRELCLSRQQLCSREWTSFSYLYLSIPLLSSSPLIPSTSLLLSGAAAQTLAILNSQNHRDVRWLFILSPALFTQYCS